MSFSDQTVTELSGIGGVVVIPDPRSSLCAQFPARQRVLREEDDLDSLVGC